MKKRGLVGILILVFAISLSFVNAQDVNNEDLQDTNEIESQEVVEDPQDVNDEINDQEENAQDIDDETDSPDEDINDENFKEESQNIDFNTELRSPGITPDSTFYFVEDSILTRFRTDLGNTEKKASEIRSMIRDGKIEEAKIALARFNKFADQLEKEVNPEDKDEAKRVASAIRSAIREIESEIPEENKKEFVDNIVERSERIETAAEIASKIKELCTELAKLDPGEFYTVCKTEDNSPKWQENLFNDLSEEQRVDAEKMFNIMSSCFRTSGRDCKCEEIPHTAFSNLCTEARPLAVACDEGRDEACTELESLDEDLDNLLADAPHLQLALEKAERGLETARFENDRFMPPECREAGATTPEECMKIMVRTHAPKECISALDSGELQFESERQFREACEDIMFRENAPPECIEAGIKDPRECGEYMFKISAPKECIEAGITGESPRDANKCREIMESLKGERPEGPRINFDCRRIENTEERLNCYDNAVSSAREFRPEEPRGPQGGWPEPCQKAQALTPESCENVMKEFGRQQFGENREMFEERRPEFEPQPRFEPQPPREGFDQQFQQPNPPLPPFGQDFGPSPEGEIREEQFEPPQEIQPQPESQPEPESSPAPEPEPSPEPTPTGSVIENDIINSDNSFVKYFFN